jgi:hypothetical protein
MFEWHKRFKEGRESLQGDERKGRPSTSGAEESTEVIQKCLAEDRTLSVWMLEVMSGIGRETVHRVRPQFQGNVSWYLLHDNAPAHSSGVVSEFLAKQEIPMLSYSSYSPDSAPADFFIP